MTLSEKIIQRIMREENLFAKSVKLKKYSSYKGEISPTVPNVVARDFTANQPNKKWVTDLTEFRLDYCIQIKPLQRRLEPPNA